MRSPRWFFLLALLSTVAFAPLSTVAGQDTTAAQRIARRAKARQDSIAKRSTSPTIDRQAAASKVDVDSLYLVLAPKPAPSPAPAPLPTPLPPPSTVQLHPYAPLSNGAAYAELPRATVDVTSVPAPTRTIAVLSLQAALDTAQTGDLLKIPAGNATSCLNVRNTARVGWVTVQGTDSTSVITCGVGGATSTVNILPGAHHVRFAGPLTITTTTDLTNAIVRSFNGETSAAQMAHDVILDSVTVTSGGHLIRRCTWLDGVRMAVVRSQLLGCASKSGDAQGTLNAQGGPYLIAWNYIEASHQCVMFGGVDPTIAGDAPSDIWVHDNRCVKPLFWKGAYPYPDPQRQVKTIVETKNVRRLLVEHNEFRNVWADAQVGFCALLKSENPGATPMSQSTDITFRYNRCVNVASGINLAAHPNGAQPMTRVTVYDNRLDSLSTKGGEGICFQLLEDVRDVVLMHNTCSNATNQAISFGDVLPTVRSAIVANIIANGDYGVKGASTGIGSATVLKWLPGGLFTDNAIVGADCSQYPAGTLCPATIPSSSPLAADGKPIGADTAKLAP